jgi:hypothetical protein
MAIGQTNEIKKRLSLQKSISKLIIESKCWFGD